jgi:hypothetical protein
MVRNFLDQIRERWYFIVLRYFTYLDANRIARHTKQYASDLKAQALIASIASERVCADSGMCASKSWADRPGSNKAPELFAKFESATRDRHDAVTTMLLDLTGKPVPPPIEGIRSVLNVTQP